jgi:hypothetical protein
MLKVVANESAQGEMDARCVLDDLLMRTDRDKFLLTATQ